VTARPETPTAQHTIETHLAALYPDLDIRVLASDLLDDFGIEGSTEHPRQRRNNWSQDDVFLVTYGDSVKRESEAPLATLSEFLTERLSGIVSGVHILPFFPFSSDDGFAVVDYETVRQDLGGWEDIRELSLRFRLMADLIINHASSESEWFKNFCARRDPGKDYFVEASPDDDLSAVVRPRSTPVLREVETSDGTRNVWCTFGPDQVDLDFSNPQVLREFVQIVRLYMDQGVGIFRLDAVAYLWKEVGGPCIHLPQTHEVIRLLRSLIELRNSAGMVITETNVPNHENLTYFGNANEAHAIYNFSLPPLLINALITGNSTHLQTWMMSMPPAQFGTAYLNFIASHDGIGVRPAEGLLSDEELQVLRHTMERFGGRISMRRGPAGGERPYEINISLLDALKGTAAGGPDAWQVERFLCAHAIMLALEGIPAIYIHSLLATENDHELVSQTGRSRSINRHSWDADRLLGLLDDPESTNSRVFHELGRIIQIRRQQPAFHPNATQYTLQLADGIFGFWRQSMYRDQSIFAIHNLTAETQEIPLEQMNLIATDSWGDLISGDVYDDPGGVIRLEPYQFAWVSNLT